MSIEANNITQISLQRGDRTYKFLDDLLASDGADIYIQPDDHIASQLLPYKDNKVFIVVGIPIFKINPANRETLADVLFNSGGPLSAPGAKRPEIPTTRQQSNSCFSFRCSKSNQTYAADAMELRPNDIVYVAEQSIISFNRTLATIVLQNFITRYTG